MSVPSQSLCPTECRMSIPSEDFFQLSIFSRSISVLSLSISPISTEDRRVKRRLLAPVQWCPVPVTLLLANNITEGKRDEKSLVAPGLSVVSDMFWGTVKISRSDSPHQLCLARTFHRRRGAGYFKSLHHMRSSA